MEGWVECGKCSLHVLEEDARAAPCPRCGQRRLKEDDCPTPKLSIKNEPQDPVPLALFQLFSHLSGQFASIVRPTLQVLIRHQS